MTLADTTAPTRIPPGAWRRYWAVRDSVPIRFLDKWTGSRWGKRCRVYVECDLFHGLPTPAMRAWIDQEATR